MANEKRLIDANELLDFVKGLKFHGGTKTRTQAGQEVLDIHIPHIVANIPTVDAVEVVHGRWLSNGMCNHKPSRFRNPDKWTIYKCSECGYSNGRKFNANYCPNCGAKMDGGNEDG